MPTPQPEQRRTPLTHLAIVLALLIAWGIAVTWFVVPPTVLFIVPNGFRGPFVIYEDLKGVDVPRVWNEYRIVVPESGIVRLRSTRMLQDWATHRAEFASGDEIRFPTQDATWTPNAFGIWSGGYGGGSSHPPRDSRFIGTEQEFRAFDFHHFDAIPKEAPRRPAKD